MSGQTGSSPSWAGSSDAPSPSYKDVRSRRRRAVAGSAICHGRLRARGAGFAHQLFEERPTRDRHCPVQRKRARRFCQRSGGRLAPQVPREDPRNGPEGQFNVLARLPPGESAGWLARPDRQDEDLSLRPLKPSRQFAAGGNRLAATSWAARSASAAGQPARHRAMLGQDESAIEAANRSGTRVNRRWRRAGRVHDVARRTRRSPAVRNRSVACRRRVKPGLPRVDHSPASRFEILSPAPRLLDPCGGQLVLSVVTR